MKNLKLTIPKPCHEGWSTMSPNEKGRFCSACSKTVVDFTKKSPEEIQSYFQANSGSRICGHFKRSQLDSIVIQIPDVSFRKQLSFQKMFVLALVLTMGTMLFSCKTQAGKIQKIDKVEVIDSISNQVIDTLKVLQKDTIPPVVKLKKNSSSCKQPRATGLPIHTTDSIINQEDEQYFEGEAGFDDDVLDGEPEWIEPFVKFIELDIPPKFKDSKLTDKDELKKEFQNNVELFIKARLQLQKDEKFNCFIRFYINSYGVIEDVFIRSNSSILSKKIEKIVYKIPRLVPAQYNDMNVKTEFKTKIRIE